MSLNVSAAQSNPEGPADSAAQSNPATIARDRRSQLAAEVVEELSSWNPREFITAFRRWHQGSFSLIHLNVLTLLEAEGPMSMSRLAEALDVSVASMTGIVDRMEKRGLVERRHDDEDRRVVLVHPADGARQVFADIDGRRRAGLTRLLERLDGDQLAGLLAGHRALRRARTAVATELSDTKMSTEAPTPESPETAEASS